MRDHDKRISDLLHLTVVSDYDVDMLREAELIARDDLRMEGFDADHPGPCEPLSFLELVDQRTMAVLESQAICDLIKRHAERNRTADMRLKAMSDTATAHKREISSLHRTIIDATVAHEGCAEGKADFLRECGVPEHNWPTFTVKAFIEVEMPWLGDESPTSRERAQFLIDADLGVGDMTVQEED